LRHVDWRTKLVSSDGRLDVVSRMNINLTPEQEQIAKDKLRSGHFRTAEDVSEEALGALRAGEKALPWLMKRTANTPMPCARC
jgi:hypothetical protein